MKIEIPSHIDATWLVAVIAAFVIAFIVVRKEPQRESERLRKEMEGLKEEIEGIKSQLPGKRLYDAACDGKVAEVSISLKSAHKQALALHPLSPPLPPLHYPHLPLAHSQNGR